MYPQVSAEVAVLTVIGIYLVLSAILRMIFRIRDSRADRDLMENGERVQGRVVDRVTYPQEDSLQSSQYKLIAEYSDSQGNRHFVKSMGHMCGADSRKALGSEIEIIYRREDPARSRFSCDRPYRISFWSVFWNVLSFAAGLLLLLSSIYGEA